MNQEALGSSSALLFTGLGSLWDVYGSVSCEMGSRQYRVFCEFICPHICLSFLCLCIHETSLSPSLMPSAVPSARDGDGEQDRDGPDVGGLSWDRGRMCIWEPQEKPC